MVGTPAGGIPEVVQHERTGLIARDGDWNDLAGQIERLLTRYCAAGALDRGREAACAATYSPAATIGRFLQIYDDIADHQPGR